MRLFSPGSALPRNGERMEEASSWSRDAAPRGSCLAGCPHRDRRRRDGERLLAATTHRRQPRRPPASGDFSPDALRARPGWARCSRRIPAPGAGRGRCDLPAGGIAAASTRGRLRCTPIPRATRAIYKPVAADLRHTLRLEVIASNGAGRASAMSQRTAVVQAKPPAPAKQPKNTTRPTIAGAPKVDQTPSAATGTWSGTTPIRFALSVAAAARAQPAAARSLEQVTKTFSPTAGEVGDTLVARVTASNVGGDHAAADSSPDRRGRGRAACAPRAAGQHGPAPAISGTAQAGQTLTASNGGLDGQPRRSASPTSGSGCVRRHLQR